MTSALQLVLVWISIISTSAYKCTNEGCYIRQTEDNRQYDNPRTERLASESPRLIERTASYSIVSRSPQRVKLSSKLEDGSRKENGSYKILNENTRFYPHISSRTGPSEDRVLFPGPTSESKTNSYIPIISEECKKSGICEDVANYPEERVASIVASLGKSINKFQIDLLDVSDTPDIAQRLGPQEENMELCAYREKIIYPRAAPDKDGRWYMVVNQKETPLQGFRVEICDTDQSPCADFASFQIGYQARCVQKHVRRPMQAFDHAGNMTEKQLKIPSCCSCEPESYMSSKDDVTILQEEHSLASPKINDVEVSEMIHARAGRSVDDDDGVFVAQVPDECLGQYFCPTVLNYPHKIIDDLYAAHGDELDKYGVSDDDDDDIYDRGGMPRNGFCPSTVNKQRAVRRSTSEPFQLVVGRRKEAYIKHVICCNTDPKKPNGGSNDCPSEYDGQCSNDFATITYNFGYKGKCVQKTIELLIPVLKNDKSYKIEPYPVNTSCECEISPIDN